MPDHVLHLNLGSFAVTDHGLLNLQSGVFGNLDAPGDEAGNRCAARLSEQEGGLGVDVHEDDFDHRLIRPILADELPDPGMDRPQPFGEGFVGIRPNAAARNIQELAAGFLDDTEPRDTQPRIDTQDTDSVRGRLVQ